MERILAQRYTLSRKLGEGGMAEVYKAKDTLLGRSVAVKILRPPFAADEAFVERFRREAQAAASLSHPNVVHVFDVGETNGTYFIVMECIEGENLKDVLRREGRLPAHEALRIAGAVARALSHAHRQGVVHRDIKPHNILLTPEGAVKVADFGIARAAACATLTQTGVVIGSVHYCAPEQVQGRASGHEADLYSLGVVLYEMLTGRLPFVADSAVAVALKHVQHVPLPPRHLVPELSRDMDALVLRALAKEPRRRHGSADEMGRDLERIAQTLPPPMPQEEPVDERTKVAAGGVALGPEEAPDDGPTRLVDPSPVGDGQEEGHMTRTRSPWRTFVYVFLFGLSFFVGLGFAAARLPAYLFPEEVTVPDLSGLTVEEARHALAERRLALEVERRVFHDAFEDGRIVSQTPPAARRVRAQRTVSVTVSRGPRMVEVPDLLGMTARQARLSVGGYGLIIGRELGEYSAAAPAGQVVAQEPAPGTRVEAGSRLDMVVSRGAEPLQRTRVPDLRGTSLDEARRELVVAGLTVGEVWEQPADGVPPQRIMDQNPAPGTDVEAGRSVDFVVSAPPRPPTTPGPTTPAATREEAVVRDVEEPPPDDTAARRVPSAGPWREYDVTVRVPEGGVQEVVILVIDELGAREVYRQQHAGGDRFTQRIAGQGPGMRIQVYMGGAMVWEGMG